MREVASPKLKVARGEKVRQYRGRGPESFAFFEIRS
jgi:hypothetical protein